jgi:hypothetical protein
MGKTVEFYRMALESEISRWNGFDRALLREDREAFGEVGNHGCLIVRITLKKPFKRANSTEWFTQLEDRVCFA